MKNYKPVTPGIWNGRVDDTTDRESFRLHQVVQQFRMDEQWPVIDNKRLNFCFLGFCSDQGVQRNLGRPGAADGPRTIRAELANLPVTFNEEVMLYDAGNIVSDHSALEEAQEVLARTVERLLNYGFFPLVLGGGHEVAYGHFHGLLRHLKAQGVSDPAPAIVNFDAHLDMRPYHKGPSSGTMFYQIADDCRREGLDYHYLCIGTQTYANTLSLYRRAESFGAQYIQAMEMTSPNAPELLGRMFRYLNNKSHLYLTICSDVFNSANAPGVSALQPFGLDPEVVLKYVKQVLRTGKVRCFDIAEVAPRFDHDRRTAKLAAVILFAVINTLAEVNKPH